MIESRFSVGQKVIVRMLKQAPQTGVVTHVNKDRYSVDIDCSKPVLRKIIENVPEKKLEAA